MTIDIHALTFIKDTHYNGGKVFFAYGWTCVQHPRITLFRRYDRKTRQITDTWRLDRTDHLSLESAVCAMEAEQCPPTSNN